MPKLGILFDIDELESASYGYAAFRIFFDAIDTHQIAGCILSHGDTNETLAGRANQYCIAVESLDESEIATVKDALSACDARGLLPLASRFLDDAHVRDEPLVYAGNIDAAGQLVNVTSYDISSVMQAWKESREEHEASSPPVTEPPPTVGRSVLLTEKLVQVIVLSEKPIPENRETTAAGFVALAFPEQLKEYDPARGTFTLRDKFTVSLLPYGFLQWNKDAIGIKGDPKKLADSLRSWAQGVEKGVHDLPRWDELHKVIGTPSWGQIYLGILLKKICPEFENGTAYRRKWTVIDIGELGKILLIGVYSIGPPARIPAAPLTVSAQPPPEAPPVKKYCIYCGFQMRVKGIYCPKCGKRQV